MIELIASRTMYMFHGTSSTFLRSILKKGLVYNPKQKVWDVARDPTLESLPGIYITNNILTAYYSAKRAIEKYQGNMLLVAVQVTDNPNLAIDEDLVGFIDGFVKDKIIRNKVYSYYILGDTEQRKSKMEEVFKDARDLLVTKIEGKQDSRRLVIALNKNKETIVKLAMCHLIDNVLKYLYQDEDKWKHFYKGHSDSPPSNIFDYVRKEPKYTRHHFRKAIRLHTDKLTKLIGRHSSLFQNTPQGIISNFRLPSIGFSGKNRIIGIVEILRKRNSPDVLEIKYNKDPKTLEYLEKEYNNYLGESLIKR